MATANQHKSLPRQVLGSKLLWMTVFVAILVAVMYFSTVGLSSQVHDNQTRFVEDAVRRSAVQCYALEGSFPSTLQYLEQNYNLSIDRSRYAVYYESMGGNLLPQIRVIAGSGR